MGKYCIDELIMGQKYIEEITVTRESVDKFAQVSGDYSPIHMDEEYAKETLFGNCISHGMLIAAYFSKAIGMNLPGEGTIYVSQNIRFKAPVYIGTKIRIEIEVIKIDKARNRVTLSTQCFYDEKILVKGEAEVIPPVK